MKALNFNQAKERVAKLRSLITDYRYHYHVLDQSIMSEAAADSLKHELAELEAEYPELITPDSPTQRVAGQPLPGFAQVRHSVQMLSLNDVFSRDEVAAWIKRTQKLAPELKPEFFIDLKLDGLACALVYEDGRICPSGVARRWLCWRRCDHECSNDGKCTDKTASMTKIIEQFLSGRTEIRGEVIMYKKDFEALNKQRQAEGKPVFANPRNLAAGSIRQLDPKLAAARPLRFRGMGYA